MSFFPLNSITNPGRGKDTSRRRRNLRPFVKRNSSLKNDLPSYPLFMVIMDDVNELLRQAEDCRQWGRNPERALELLQRARELGSDRATVELGYMYRNGAMYRNGERYRD